MRMKHYILFLLGFFISIVLISCSSSPELQRYEEEEFQKYMDSFKIATFEKLSLSYEEDFEIRKTVELKKIIDSITGSIDTFEVHAPSIEEEVINPSILFDSIPN